MQVRFHFDFGSPYSYLGWQRIRRAPERFPGIEQVAVSAGHLFAMDGTAPNATFPNQRAYMWEDCRRVADGITVPFAPPPDGGVGAFPVRSLDALRLHGLAVERGLAEAWRKAVFLAYFEDGRDISDLEVLDELMERVGLPGTAAVAKEPRWKQRLADATQAAYDAGAPGVPFITVQDGDAVERFWGQDRMDLVAQRLAGT